MSVVICGHCGAKNRVDPNRAAGEVPKCGRCGTKLDPNAPLTFTDDNFADAVLGSGSTPVLVDCWAPWCGPCRMIAPVIDQLAAESNGRWRVGKLNTDENQATASKFKIEGIPTFLFFKNGQLVDRLVGAHPKPNIEATLKRWA